MYIHICIYIYIFYMESTNSKSQPCAYCAHALSNKLSCRAKRRG